MVHLNTNGAANIVIKGYGSDTIVDVELLAYFAKSVAGRNDVNTTVNLPSLAVYFAQTRTEY